MKCSVSQGSIISSLSADGTDPFNNGKDLMKLQDIFDIEEKEISNLFEANSSMLKIPMIPGGVLGLKTDGGVPLAAENWTQKDRGKNWICGQKDRFL